ncbi:MAG TPA: MoaD/ThiS family protein [Rhizomicrobium sp.]|nr:MoaD/ThiS family protein [Rhizomicrobium sp.]
MKLVFLGRFREIAAPGLADMARPQGVETLGQLQAWLARAEPALAEALKGARTQIAVNQAIVRDPSHAIRDQDEIAFLPPMSGG